MLVAVKDASAFHRKQTLRLVAQVKVQYIPIQSKIYKLMYIFQLNN